MDSSALRGNSNGRGLAGNSDRGWTGTEEPMFERPNVRLGAGDIVLGDAEVVLEVNSDLGSGFISEPVAETDEDDNACDCEKHGDDFWVVI